MTKRTTLIFTAVIIIFFSIITWTTLNTISSYRGISATAATAGNAFFNNQLAGILPVSVSTTMLVYFTASGSLIAVYCKNNPIFYNIQQRIGYDAFIKKALLRTAIVTTLSSLITSLYEILLITLMIHPIDLMFTENKNLSSGLGFFDNGSLSGIVIFIALSSLGWGVYASFIFSVGLFIKKTPVYLITGAVIGTILIVAPALISNAFNRTLVPFLNLFILPTLIVPGQMQLVGNGPAITPVYSSFIIATTIYITVTWALTRLWIVRKQKVG